MVIINISLELKTKKKAQCYNSFIALDTSTVEIKPFTLAFIYISHIHVHESFLFKKTKKFSIWSINKRKTKALKSAFDQCYQKK